MKKIIFIFVLLAAISCSKDDPAPVTGTPKPLVPAPPTGDVIAMGTFNSGAHSTSGKVSVNDQKIMTFENFQTDSGPDLKVYLSKDMGASSYIRIGVLKSATGTQTYQVPGSPDYKEYPFVLIWCEAYSVLFGYSKLE